MSEDTAYKIAQNIIAKSSVPLRLWRNPDFQEWLTSTVTPIMERTKELAATQDMTTEQGRKLSEIQAIKYQEMRSVFHDLFHSLETTESAAREIVAKRSGDPIVMKRR